MYANYGRNMMAPPVSPESHTLSTPQWTAISGVGKTMRRHTQNVRLADLACQTTQCGKTKAIILRKLTGGRTEAGETREGGNEAEKEGGGRAQQKRSSAKEADLESPRKSPDANRAKELKRLRPKTDDLDSLQNRTKTSPTVHLPRRTKTSCVHSQDPQG